MIRLLGPAACLFVAVGTKALCQDPAQAEQARFRADCRLAHQVLTTGHPEPRRQWALGVISWCPEAGEALADAWRQPPTDQRLLLHLAQRSSTVADVRILSAVLAIAADASAAQELRRIATGVVVKQFDPKLAVLEQFWLEPEENILAHSSHGYHKPGTEPLRSDDRSRIVATFRAIGSSDPDAHMRRVAAALATELERRRD